VSGLTSHSGRQLLLITLSTNYAGRTASPRTRVLGSMASHSRREMSTALHLK